MSTRRPTILVATSYVEDRHGLPAASVPGGYFGSIVAAGGVPLLVPPMQRGAAWKHLVDRGDAVMVIGGFDIDPAIYGQKKHPKTRLTLPQRQEADARILRWAERRRMPVMGICLGIQTLAVHRGGTLVQHIPDQWPGAVRHTCDASKKTWPRHPVHIDPDSRLARIVRATDLSVNTHHHQGVLRAGRHLAAVAWSPDGLIEAVEDPRPDRFVLGIQWHPERLSDEAAHLAPFKALVREARAWRKSV